MWSLVATRCQGVYEYQNLLFQSLHLYSQSKLHGCIEWLQIISYTLSSKVLCLTLFLWVRAYYIKNRESNHTLCLKMVQNNGVHWQSAKVVTANIKWQKRKHSGLPSHFRSMTLISKVRAIFKKTLTRLFGVLLFDATTVGKVIGSGVNSPQ